MASDPSCLEVPRLRLATEADAGLLATIHQAAFPVAEAWSGDVFGLQLVLPNVMGLLHGEDGLVLARVAGEEAEILHPRGGAGGKTTRGGDRSAAGGNRPAGGVRRGRRFP